MLLRVVRRQVSTFNNIDSVQKSREEFRPRQFILCIPRGEEQSMTNIVV